MNEQMKMVLESKRLERSRLAALPFVDKIPLLEKLRDRTIAIAGSALYEVRGSHEGKAWLLRETGPAYKPEKRD